MPRLNSLICFGLFTGQAYAPKAVRPTPSSHCFRSRVMPPGESTSRVSLPVNVTHVRLHDVGRIVHLGRHSVPPGACHTPCFTYLTLKSPNLTAHPRIIYALAATFPLIIAPFTLIGMRNVISCLHVTADSDVETKQKAEVKAILQE